MRVVLVLAFAYLIGSVLPADLLARVRGIDIREVGTGNPGATNALHELGLIPGLLTGAYDMSVGLVSMYVAWRLGLPTQWVYAAGLAALAGHIFPVLFGFHGGQGMAAATGMLLWGIARGVQQGWLAAAGLVVLGAVALLVYALTRNLTAVGVFAVPLLLVELLVGGGDWLFLAFMTVIAVLVWAVQVQVARSTHALQLFSPARVRRTRLGPR